MKQAEEAGMEKGMEKVAIRMKHKGIHYDEIAEITGLSLAEIEKLEPETN